MSNYLIEIGTEELPARLIPESLSRLAELTKTALDEANLSYGLMESFATPRRLTLIVKDLLDKQPTAKKTVKGPPVKTSFTEDGQPSKAAEGFAAKNGLAVSELTRQEVGGVEYLIADITVVGKTAQEVLKEIAPKVITQLSGERLMRAGASDFRFMRPIRWIVSLLDSQVVEFELDGILSGRQSHGHRILNGKTINIDSASTYKEQLKAASVIVDQEERKELIKKQVLEAAKAKGGDYRDPDEAIISEVVHLTEWPSAITGGFPEEYLELPQGLIETVMIHHQRYFPLTKAGNEKQLLPFFVAVSNNDRKDAVDTIQKGNERVLKARLADGKFFYFDDQKCKLGDRLSDLGQLTYQEGLGTYLDKRERLIALSEHVSKTLSLDDKTSICLERTLDLCKLDLVSNLVRELPELQGYVGSWYADKEGQPKEVVEAIAQHYAPRSGEPVEPSHVVGNLASAIDKLDTLVGLFALGRRPSGSSDPFALRRQAQGLIDILVDGLRQYSINLTELIDFSFAKCEPVLTASAKNAKKVIDAQKTATDLSEFLISRLKGKLLETGYSREVVEAASGSDALSDVQRVLLKAQIIRDLLKEKGSPIVKAGVRVAKILPSNGERSKNIEVDAQLFSEDIENKLWKAISTLTAQLPIERLAQLKKESDYKNLIEQLANIAPMFEEYFDKVMVNDTDPAKRANRHAMLSHVNSYFAAIGDFPHLQSLIN